MEWRKYKTPPFFIKFKYWLGYSLFFIAVTYGLWNPPPELWKIKPTWLLLASLVAVVMFILQGWQVKVFLKYHNIQTDWLYPALFTARKSVLNTILPARSGTFILMKMLTNTYHLKWFDFIKFILIASIASLLVSVLGGIWLFLPIIYSLLFLFIILVIIGLSIRYSLFVYASCFPSLLLIAFGLYFSTIMAFFCLLRGFGNMISIADISYLAVALNILAQFSFTPGNVGVREVIVGIIAPHISLPISTGIIASAIFYIIRLVVYSIILFWLEWFSKKKTRLLISYVNNLLK